MTALECFSDFKTRRLYETFIHLKEDEVLKKSIYRFLICYQFNKCRLCFWAILHSSPVHIQTYDFGLEWNDFFKIFIQCYYMQVTLFKTKIVSN